MAETGLGRWPSGPAPLEVRQAKKKASDRAYRDAHLDAARARNAAYRAAHAEELTDYWLRWRYGIGSQRLLEMIDAQNGRCAVCQRVMDGDVKVRAPHIDHDRKCCPGNRSCGDCVRGLLCARCNVGVGMLGDDPEVIDGAAAYVRQFRRPTNG